MNHIPQPAIEATVLPSVSPSAWMSLRLQQVDTAIKKELIELVAYLREKAAETDDELELQALFTRLELIGKTGAGAGRKVLRDKLLRVGKKGKSTYFGVKIVYKNCSSGSADFSVPRRPTDTPPLTAEVVETTEEEAEEKRQAAIIQAVEQAVKDLKICQAKVDLTKLKESLSIEVFKKARFLNAATARFNAIMNPPLTLEQQEQGIGQLLGGLIDCDSLADLAALEASAPEVASKLRFKMAAQERYNQLMDNPSNHDLDLLAQQQEKLYLAR